MKKNWLVLLNLASLREESREHSLELSMVSLESTYAMPSASLQA